MSNEAGKFSPFPKIHLYFYSRCNGNDMGKIYVEIQGGQVTPVAPFWGRPCCCGNLMCLPGIIKIQYRVTAEMSRMHFCDTRLILMYARVVNIPCLNRQYYRYIWKRKLLVEVEFNASLDTV